MQNRMSSLVCGTIVVTAMLTAVLAQPYWGLNWEWTAVDRLALTTEQFNRIQEIVDKWQEEMLPLWSNLQTKNLELQRLRWNATAAPAMVEGKTRELWDLQAQWQGKLLERRTAIRDVLTEQQQVRYDALGMGYGRGRGPCGLGLGRGLSGGFGWRRGPGRRAVAPSEFGYCGPGWGCGPCGMGLGRAGW